MTEGEKREWSLGKYKYRLAALGEDIVDNIACIETTVDFYIGRDWRKRQIFHLWEPVM